jgi:hypothetical protein
MIGPKLIWTQGKRNSKNLAALHVITPKYFMRLQNALQNYRTTQYMPKSLEAQVLGCARSGASSESTLEKSTPCKTQPETADGRAQTNTRGFEKTSLAIRVMGFAQTEA